MATITEINPYNPVLSDLSLSKPTSSIGVMTATIKKELIMLKRYKANLLGQLIRTLLFILVFWFFASALEFNDFFDNSKKTVFLFYLAGFSLLMYDSVALWSPFQTVQTDLMNGTLESIYSSPSPRYAYFMGSVIAQAIISTFFFIPIFVTVIYIGGVTAINIGMLVIAVLLVVATLSFFGVIIALLAIMYKQVNSLVGLLGTLFTFISGMFMPLSAFPKALLYFSYIFPYTWGIELMRYYSFNTNWETVYPIWIVWSVMILTAVFYFLVSLKLLKKVEKYAKKQGLHIL
ncbi:MAG: ABC transporter permease [Candidatus Heimdallarchaeota archaeon]|nr:ABC transporter permease [Candidatus Heimdallarchaeota archaeon]